MRVDRYDTEGNFGPSLMTLRERVSVIFGSPPADTEGELRA